MSHPLDRPIWTALSTRQSTVAEGGERARRYRPSIVPFGASADDAADSVRALGNLVGRGETLVLLQADTIALPPGLTAFLTAEGVQMVAGSRAPAAPDPRIELLTAADAPEMLALATLTKPGPFTLQALALGEFWGVRIDGRLAAMAGERMKQPGYAEISGVCSHPDFRGLGLARLLSVHVADRIAARGETPYLHAFATNAAAVRLYESIGFALRTSVNVAMARREA